MAITDWILQIEGTQQGHNLALALALLAALSHAVFGALQKGRFDPWLSRGAIDFGYLSMSLPVALIFFPFPEPALWPIYGGVIVIHSTYKYLQAMAYVRGAYTVVYPVVRGTGPLFAVIGAYVIFGEVFTLMQWMGVCVLLAGIFGLAVFNLRYLDTARDTLMAALGYAVITGLFVALYTTYDAFGIRMAENPFGFLVWFFVVDGLVFPIIGARRWLKMQNRPAIGPLLTRGYLGGLVAFCSFGSIMLATRLDKVGEAAVLRETSTVFAAFIGWMFLKEKVGLGRAMLMALIALGAVIVEMGG